MGCADQHVVSGDAAGPGDSRADIGHEVSTFTGKALRPPDAVRREDGHAVATTLSDDGACVERIVHAAEERVARDKSQVGNIEGRRDVHTRRPGCECVVQGWLLADCVRGCDRVRPKDVQWRRPGQAGSWGA